MILVNNHEGQLCNQLLLLANVYATAIDANQKVYHIYWKGNEKLFRKSSNKNFGYPPIKLDRLFLYYNRYVLKKRAKKYNYSERREFQDEKRRRIKSRAKHRIHIVDDWAYRDYEALLRHHNRIADLFRPTVEAEKRIKSFWRELGCQPETITVGLHIRRGDYRMWQDGKYYYSDEAYKNWLLDLAKGMPNKIKFILCSNEEIQLSNFESDVYSVYKAPGTQMEDLYTLAQCDYIMGPPSTYSWWAAYYGSKKYLTLRRINQRIRLDQFREIEGEEFTEVYADQMVMYGAL